MTNPLLVEFRRIGHLGDGPERAANALLKPLRLACGKEVSVTLAHDSPFVDQEEHLRTTYRVALFVLSITLWLPCTLVGIAVHLFSHTHDETYHRYLDTSLGFTPLLEPEPSDVPAPQSAPPEAHLEMRRLIQTNPTRAVQKILQDQGLSLGEAKREADLLVADDELFTLFSELNQHALPSSGQPLDNLISDVGKMVVKAYNRKVLLSLSAFMNRQLGPDITNDFFGDSTYFPPEIARNERICTTADCVSIFESAQRRHSEIQAERVPSPEGSRGEFDQIMTQVQFEISRGMLKATPQSIFVRHPRVRDLLRLLDDPEAQKEFSEIIDLGFILQEARNPTVHLFSSAEKKLFQALGLNVKPVEENKERDKRRLRGLISTANFLRTYREHRLPEELQELNGIELFLKRTALEWRLEEAGGDKALAQNLMPLIHSLADRERQLQTIETKCINTLEIQMLSHPYLRDHPDQRASILLDSKMKIQRRLNFKMKREAEYLGRLFRSRSLVPPSLFPLTPTETLETIKAWVKLGETERDKALEWFQSWGFPVAKDLIQGISDPSECLGVGVCNAISTRLMLLEQRYPSIASDDLHSHVKVLGTDRIRQAEYLLADMSCFRGNESSGSRSLRLRRLGIKDQKVLFHMKSTAELQTARHLITLPKLSQTNAVVGLTLSGKSDGERWGHLCYVRIDLHHRVIRFFDPNLGMSKNFYPQEGGNETTAVRDMLACFSDHLNRSYPGLDTIFGVQNRLIGQRAAPARRPAQTAVSLPGEPAPQLPFPWLAAVPIESCF